MKEVDRKAEIELTEEDLLITINALGLFNVPVQNADRVKIIINKMSAMIDQLRAK